MALTPMMQQYLNIKEKNKDSILFFRLGDFYEMFFEDAKLVSSELGLTLTGKSCGLEERAPMCGIPFHSVNTYIPKLIEKGYKIAICEQTEEAGKGIKLVNREVVKIITPGTILDPNILKDKQNNYIANYIIEKDKAVISYSDISTGDTNISTVVSKNITETICSEISRISPKEIVLKEKFLDHKVTKEIKEKFNVYISKYNESIENNFLIEKLKLKDIQINAINHLLGYINNSQKDGMNQINNINIYEVNKYMNLDMQTRRNLEIIESNREKTKKGSLLWVLDKTVTSMGGRNLREWIQNPLLDKDMINLRLNATDTLINKFIVKDNIVNLLKTVYDIERLISKIVTGSANARDFISLKNSLENLPNIKQELKELSNDKYLKYIYENFDILDNVYNIINESLIEDAPIAIKEGNIIKDGYNKDVDNYRQAKTEGKSWLMNLEAKEKELTGINKLKIGFNRIFGYYIEVTNSYKYLVDKEKYITKQTLAGCERYFTKELKEIEEKILDAEDKINDLEYKIFCDIRNKVSSNVIRIQKTAKFIAILDTLTSYANVSLDYNYIKPQINENNEIDILEGRHPVVESSLKDVEFIPNNTKLDNEEDNILIITGPNMSGKSTYMRQVSLICYMAQIGCFVPASKASLPILDRIFTRVGASDDLAMGESTFMVEMSELSNILRNATDRSLVILDEIGRGTSTYDGLSIAWGVVDYIVKDIGCKTLFATHYHELTELEEKYKGVRNYSVDVSENGEDVVFLHKITPGAANESYGIYVAKLAGVPNKLLKFSRNILKELKLTDIAKKGISQSKKINAETIAVDIFNYKLNEMSEYIKNIDLDGMSPIEGLQELYKIKEKLK